MAQAARDARAADLHSAVPEPAQRGSAQRSSDRLARLALTAPAELLQAERVFLRVFPPRLES